MKISSLNTCLGLKNKIETLRQTKEILVNDIIFFQETEILENDSESSYSIPSFKVYKSLNTPKSRLCAFVKIKLNHTVRLCDGLEVIKIETDKLQVFGLYRPFKIAKNKTYASYLSEVIEWIRHNISVDKNIIIIGDTNLDLNQKTNTGYANYHLLQQWLTFTDSLNLTQIVKENTWSRIVKGSLKSSLLDHAYSNEIEMEASLHDVNIGDHLLITLSTPQQDNTLWEEKRIIRDWAKYSQQSLIQALNIQPDRFEPMSINEHEDFFSLEILSALNKIAPERRTRLHEASPLYTPKINRLKSKKTQMLKKARKNNDPELLKKARMLDKSIRQAFKEESRRQIRRVVKTNNPKDLWNAVRTAKGDSKGSLPRKLNDEQGNEAHSDEEKANMFATTFENKVKQINSTSKETYNGKRVIFTEGGKLFTEERLDSAFKNIKAKSSFGFDRVPMRVLVDSYPKTKPVILSLLNKIESQKLIPDKWKVSRVIPIFKKGVDSLVSNYRPISNLCSLAKIMEKMILMELLDIAAANNIDLTGTSQYGFKKDPAQLQYLL